MLTMPYGKFTYVVQYQQIVLPTALWVTHNVGYERLVLSACNPLYSAAQRIIVFAKLRSVTPLGPARQAQGVGPRCARRPWGRFRQGSPGAVRSAHGPEPKFPRPYRAVAGRVWTLASDRSWGPDPMQRAAIAVDPLEYSPFGEIAMNAAKLKEQIEQGEYEVDPVAVADAMLRRLTRPRAVAPALRTSARTRTARRQRR